MDSITFKQTGPGLQLVSAFISQQQRLGSSAVSGERGETKHLIFSETKEET